MSNEWTPLKNKVKNVSTITLSVVIFEITGSSKILLKSSFQKTLHITAREMTWGNKFYFTVAHLMER